MAQFVIKKTKSGFTFNLKASNKETIATSEVYNTKDSCKRGIKSVIKNAKAHELAFRSFCTKYRYTYKYTQFFCVYLAYLYYLLYYYNNIKYIGLPFALQVIYLSLYPWHIPTDIY